MIVFCSVDHYVTFNIERYCASFRLKIHDMYMIKSFKEERCGGWGGGSSEGCLKWGCGGH